MRTLTFIVGLMLLLIAVYHCSAMPHAVNTKPDPCCFKFFQRRIPKTEIHSINKTHHGCPTPAFLIGTPRGVFCVKQTEKWAENAFIRLHNL